MQCRGKRLCFHLLVKREETPNPMDNSERAHISQCCTGILPLRPEAGCSPPSSADFKNEWSCTSTPHGFMDSTTKKKVFYLTLLTCSVRGWFDSTGKEWRQIRLQGLKIRKSYKALRACCYIEVSFCCSVVFRIAKINWQIHDHVGKGENRNPHTVTTRENVFIAETGGFMLINATEFWESSSGCRY